MRSKKIAIIGVFILFIFPLLIKITIFILQSSINPGPENVEEGVNLIAEASIPWWIEIIEWLAQLPGKIGAFLIIGLIIFLKWIGDIR